ncbi:hypothetical protein PhaeoP66_03215 [Phaeobacter inhibens]|uniref:Uncharacterized protein n=1 Tax=Phaeobacter inhibens TaxID=221822 RepID=A0ABM6RHL5_9RHOB|nr:hypothetical protein [Phaeobacter inhibens]AUQ95957.1 hypothetical protein PhaeoP66_03215 [Phaeobacter inhibens]
MLKTLKTMSSLIGCLAVMSCVAPGDFCTVVKGPIEFEPETARAVVRTDRADAESIAVQNDYGRDRCDWRY